MSAPPIAFIGVGNIGSRMATRLINAGHPVTVYDPNETAVAALVVEGATAATDPAAAAAGADFVLLSLPNPAIFDSAVSGPRGIIEGAHCGTIVLDFSTGDPSTARRAAQTLTTKDIDFLDAPVSGGVVGAETGNLVIMVGGPDEILERARPILDVLAARIVHCGGTGYGQLTKLSHNLLAAINTVALGEVLSASVKAGADLAILIEVLSSGLAGSKMLDYLPETLFTEDRPANFALDLMNKDIGLALKEFGNQPMMLGQLTRQIYHVAAAEGLGRKDSTSVAEVYERLLDVRLSLS